MTKWVADILERHCGKKFFVFMAGVGIICGFVKLYIEMAGAEYDIQEVRDVIETAIIGIAILGFGSAVSVGLSDFGKGAKPESTPVQEYKPPQGKS